MFTTPCFIRKNTPELRKKLEELGYNRYPFYIDNGHYLYLNREFYHTGTVGYTEEIEIMIDCGTNEELFLALAALRNDTDVNQWFIYDTIGNQVGKFETVEWVKCLNVKMEDYFSYDNIYKFMRKVTVEEIIEHFKKE